MPKVVFTHAVKDVAHWASKHSERVKAFAPWAILMSLLFAAGIWIVFQPMQMRGMMQMAR